METLIFTITKRPYVFLFLVAFLFLSIRHLGLAKTIIWLFVGYIIAFLSEYSSIHNGFPYGEYHYVYENLRGELILAGVPVWDSVSYSFLSYAGYSTAVYALPRAKIWKLWIVGSALTVILDLLTDPVAKLGEKWFLGKIYYYAADGIYFHVPWTNFAGWFLVALAIVGINLLIFKFAFGNTNAKKHPDWLNLAFYVSICLFSTAIAFAIGATLLGCINLSITVGILLFLRLRLS